MRFVGHLLDEALNRSDSYAQGVVQAKVAFNERLGPGREGKDPAFGFTSIGPALAIDRQAVVLPVNLVFGQASQFRNAQAGIQERPHDQFFLVGGASIGQPVGFVLGQRFSFVLVGHLSGTLSIVRSFSSQWRFGGVCQPLLFSQDGYRAGMSNLEEVAIVL